jgi:hypothetical protein
MKGRGSEEQRSVGSRASWGSGAPLRELLKMLATALRLPRAACAWVGCSGAAPLHLHLHLHLKQQQQSAGLIHLRRSGCFVFDVL